MPEREPQLVVAEVAGVDLERLVRLVVSPLARIESVRYGPLCGCQLSVATDNETGYRRRLAAAVAGYIVRHWVRSCADAIIRRRHRALSPLERAVVLRHAAVRMRPRLSSVAALLDEYLARESILIVDGFATFRVPGLRQDVEDAVDEGVDSVMLDREYREFLTVVAGVVAGHSPKVGDIHVYWGEAGRFRLTDERGESIGEPGTPGCEWTPIGALDRHDILISSLVAAGPSRVVVHRAEDHPLRSQPAYDLLRIVFGHRLLLCPGCSQCCPVSRSQEEDPGCPR